MKSTTAMQVSPREGLIKTLWCSHKLLVLKNLKFGIKIFLKQMIKKIFLEDLYLMSQNIHLSSQINLE